MPVDRPIPAFYCVYVLRSRIKPGSLYIGSTPNPVRRLAQHNGAAKGGAVRTSRTNLKPWDMILFVEGFPSQIAALQFEWALQHPHLTLHIEPSARLVMPTKSGKSNRPALPRRTLPSILSNLHLLFRVPSFARWPLNLRIFAPDIAAAWTKNTAKTVNDLPPHVGVKHDFPEESKEAGKGKESEVEKLPMHEDTNHPIHKIAVDYEPLTERVAKSSDIFTFETATECAVCSKPLHADNIGSKLAVCPHGTCEAVSHIHCLGSHFLKTSGEEDEDALIPIHGTCPKCKKETQWVDIVREATLRMRGSKDVEKLLKRKARAESKKRKLAEQAEKAAKRKARGRSESVVPASSVIPASDDDDDSLSSLSDIEEELEVDEEQGEDEIEDDGFIDIDDLAPPSSQAPAADMQPLDEDVFMSRVTAGAKSKLDKLTAKAPSPKAKKFKKPPKIGKEVIEIPDSEAESDDSWGDALEVD